MAEDLLICPTIDAPWCAKGSVFTHQCRQCGSRVIVAPSSAALLARRPDIQILCLSCFLATNQPIKEARPAADARTLVREIEEAIPNPWHKRN